MVVIFTTAVELTQKNHVVYDEYSWILSLRPVGNLVGVQVGGLVLEYVKICPRSCLVISTIISGLAFILYPLVPSLVVMSFSMIIFSTFTSAAKLGNVLVCGCYDKLHGDQTYVHKVIE